MFLLQVDAVPDDRLESWKEIAEHLGRDVRTVRRWEKKGMPVQRLPGAKGRVFAYASELDAWLKTAAGSVPLETRSSSAQERLRDWRIWALTTGTLAVVLAVLLLAWLRPGRPA